ncbi:MAG: hypothetical protein MJ180_04870 [Candidatus Gastranaerophilales bacterium]|nr:hypothetical protein [Candidatus Gastranaerophilales bacterium]
MAVGFSFLQKTASTQSNTGAAKASAAKSNNNQNASSVFAQNPQGNKAASNKEDMASMKTSDFIKDAYNNKAGDVNIQNHNGEDETQPDGVTLPLTVEYNNQTFNSHGKNFEEMVKEISKQTHDSTCKVESELKKKYTSVTGGSINMSA